MLASARQLAQIALTFVVLAAFVAAGCGGDGESEPAGTAETQTTSTTTTETDPTETTSPTTTEENPSEPTLVRVVVVNGAPKGGIVRRSVDVGDRVVITVTSDVADEVHLHGYDLTAEVAARGTVRMPFRATVPGRFEVELEERGVQIADLTVEP